MRDTLVSTKNRIPLVVAAAISIVGLVVSTLSVAYIAGMFGISTALATQIVNAIQVGGIALAVVLGVLSGGVGAVAVATARKFLLKWTERMVVA